MVAEKSAAMRSMTPRMALHAACDLTGVWEFARHLPSPQAAIANVNRLLSYAAEYEESCVISGTSLTTSGLLQYFDVLSANEEDHIAHSGGDAVHVVTWHGAKGLEWPMVVVYSLNSKAQNRFFSVTADTHGEFTLDSPVANRRIRYVPLPYNWKSRDTVTYTSVMQPSKEYVASQHVAENEWLRLLYVVFTRARDYMVFTGRADKVAALDTDGIPLFELPQIPDDSPKEWTVLSLSPLEPPARTALTGREWFPYATERTSRQPAKISPSSLDLGAQKIAGKVLSTETLWDPIALPKDVDREIVGTAFHQYFAVDTSRLDETEKREVAARILAGYELSASIAPEILVRCGVLIDEWIARRWPKAVRRREWPLRMEHAGFTIEGQADVVLETLTEFSVVDFKTGVGSPEALTAKAVGYAPQLMVYSEVIRIAAGKTCTGAVVCFPVAGIAVELEVKDAGAILSALES
jgi:ATP-dependent exoDNAse (exonuclease V) beta subunit